MTSSRQDNERIIYSLSKRIAMSLTPGNFDFLLAMRLQAQQQLCGLCEYFSRLNILNVNMTFMVTHGKLTAWSM